ncbi:MAG: hypothetical protein K6T65_06040 [Peptococcaceae bacterium]|nr:hypothetical protein [Peptococcaceae bacterium]
MDILEQMKKSYYDNLSSFSLAAEAIVDEIKHFFAMFQTGYRLQIKQYPLYRFEVRVKTWDSIAEKIERKIQYKDAKTLDDIPDLIGIYIIVELDEDVEKVVRLFEKEKKELARFSHISSLTHIPTRHENGKQTHHYDGVMVWKDTKFNFEIQVRSEVENLWSNIEHMSFYKNKVKSRNDRILNRLKEHSYNLLLQADEVLSILRRERMKNDMLDLKEKMMDALEGLFDGIKIRDVEAISGYMYECWAMPFDKMTVEDFEHFFSSSAKVTDQEVMDLLEAFRPDSTHRRLYKYLKENMTLSDSIILKIGIATNESGAAVEYLLMDMEEACCSSCGEWVDYNDADFFAAHVEMRGDFYCRDCAQKLLSYCQVCGSILTSSKVCLSCASRLAEKNNKSRPAGGIDKSKPWFGHK